MLDETFAEAIVHRARHVVLGKRLRPFSRWHAFLLDALNSPFSGAAVPIDFPALYIAVEVCRCKWPHRPRTGRLSLFRRACTLRKYWRKFHAEVSAFSVYLADYNSSPVFITGEDSRSVKTPQYLYQIAALLVNDSRLTKAEAWNMPVGEGNWWLAACAEARGANIDILSPEDRAQCKELGIEV